MSLLDRFGRAPWLADALRAEGLDVYEVPGWQSRGRGLTMIRGVVWHHTASSPRTSDTAMAALLRDGRRDLAGPLSQLGLERDGTWVVVAAGRANHNGYGEWGNSSLGVEAYNDGVGEPWPAVQLDAYERGTAAILRRLGFGVDRMKGHKETDPGRKIDPAGIDMEAARRQVAHIITNPKDGFMASLNEQEQRELLTKTRQIHREFFVSQPSEFDGDGNETRAGTLRWRMSTLMRRSRDLVTGDRPK